MPELDQKYTYADYLTNNINSLKYIKRDVTLWTREKDESKLMNT